MDDLWAVTAELPYRFHSIKTAQFPKQNLMPYLNSTEANTLIIWFFSKLCGWVDLLDQKLAQRPGPESGGE